MQKEKNDLNEKLFCWENAKTHFFIEIILYCLLIFIEIRSKDYSFLGARSFSGIFCKR